MLVNGRAGHAMTAPSTAGEGGTMSITTRTPRREIDTLRERFDKLFTELATWPTKTVTEPTTIPLDIKETEQELVITASMPGFKPEEISVEVTGDVLTIKAETKEEREETEGIWHLQERRYGAYQRRFVLPVPVYSDEARAVYENGVLTLTLAKSTQMPKRQIAVTTP
jgi:HSP20 family protein